jgi:hypothetical protein
VIRRVLVFIGLVSQLPICRGSDHTLGTMKEPHPLVDFKTLLLRKRLEEIVAIPATLYFPAGIVAQLNEICDQSGYTPGNLSLNRSRVRSTTGIDSTETLLSALKEDQEKFAFSIVRPEEE